VEEGSDEIRIEIVDVAETQRMLLARNESYFAESGGRYERDIKMKASPCE
jgi:hypothetical protein